jgi:hypothetical protein
MKLALLTILPLCAINPCRGQNIGKIVVVSEMSDEPPTKQGQPKHTIEYELNTNGDFVATNVKKDNIRGGLSDIKTIEAKRINKIRHWEDIKKAKFTVLDLGIDRNTIELASENSNHRLNFGLPDEIVLDVDSLHFCQNYKMTKSMSTGGERISVTMLAKSRPTAQFTFHSNDIGTGEFKLKEYIFCYAILNDRIPDEFPHFNFFSKERLAEVVVYYQKTLECEGYYFQEYADRNHLSGKERRMKVGWNFVGYMRERNKKN